MSHGNRIQHEDSASRAPRAGFWQFRRSKLAMESLAQLPEIVGSPNSTKQNRAKRPVPCHAPGQQQGHSAGGLSRARRASATAKARLPLRTNVKQASILRVQERGTLRGGFHLTHCPRSPVRRRRLASCSFAQQLALQTVGSDGLPKKNASVWVGKFESFPCRIRGAA